MNLQPLPTKTRTSFDVPALIKLLAKEKRIATSASFEDLLVIRNYLDRHPELKLRLTQTKIEGGYHIQLRYRHDNP
jgi:hypothetical protein